MPAIADRATASRTRIASAAEAERRRIQRDLHDGTQQELLALIAKIALVRGRQPASADVLDELQEDAQRALTGLRELAHGIHPPVLTDRGLVAAVDERVARMPVRTALDAAGVAGRRYTDETEGAAYFVVSEALANVLKHADATRVTVGVDEDGGTLRITVTDDGCGLDADAGAGSGLVGLADRVEAVGGRLSIGPGTPRGTVVTAALPVRPRERTP